MSVEELFGQDLLTFLHRNIKKFGCVLQVYWVGPYIGSTISSIVYQFSEFINDYFERRRQENENTKLGTVLLLIGWLGSRVVSVLDSGTEWPGFKSQSRRCRATVLGKLFTPIVPLFTNQQNW